MIEFIYALVGMIMSIIGFILLRIKKQQINKAVAILLTIMLIVLFVVCTLFVLFCLIFLRGGTYTGALLP